MIELSRYTSIDNNNDDTSNAVWSNQLATPVMIEKDSYVMVNRVFLDLQQIDQQSIEIAQDIVWSLVFIVYSIANGISQVQTNIETTPPPSNTFSYNGQPSYLGLDQDDGNSIPYLDRFDVYISAGVYLRSELALLVTKQLQGLYLTSFDKFPSFNNIPTMQFTYPTKPAPPVLVNGLPVWTRTPPVTRAQGNEMITPFLKPIITTQDPDTKMYRMYRRLNIISQYTDPLVWTPMFINNQSNNNGAYVTLGQTQVLMADGVTGLNAYDGTLVGTTQISMIYDTQAGKFAFQYMHSPMVNGGNACVGTYTERTQSDETPVEPYVDYKTYWLQAQSGIMFVDMYTNITDSNNNDVFFQTIGLQRSDLINDAITAQLFQTAGGQNSSDIDPASFYKITTKDYMPLGGMISAETQTKTGSGSTTYKMSVNGFQPYILGYNFIDSSISDQVTFSNSPISSLQNGGHYLVSVTGGYQNPYINQNALMQFSEVVPTFYQSQGGFIQTMSSSQIIYTHKGVPFNLSNVSVRVINPITKLPLSKALLGGNSTIYLQVSKELKDKPVEVAKSDDEKSKVS